MTSTDFTFQIRCILPYVRPRAILHIFDHQALWSAYGVHFHHMQVRFYEFLQFFNQFFRKFFTVLCSVVVFGNVLSNQQWAGAFIVFTGLTMDAYFNF